jgi:hypothetical protein
LNNPTEHSKMKIIGMGLCNDVSYFVFQFVTWFRFPISDGRMYRPRGAEVRVGVWKKLWKYNHFVSEVQ